MGAFVDVEGAVNAIAISDVALTPVSAAHVLVSLHGEVAALQISSPLDMASVAVDGALGFYC